MQERRYTEWFRFVSQGVPGDAFHVVRFRGTEGLNTLFNFTIELVSADAATQQTVGPLSWSVSLRDAIGGLFAWKVTLMALLLLWSVCYYRPFCRFLCPLGALYGLANPVSLYRYRIDEEKCTGCGLCARVCKLGIDPRKTPNSPQCIRCGECVRRCPEQAILPAKLFQRRRGGCAGCTGACRREKA